MYANEIIALKVMDVASGTTFGSVTGMLIDGDRRQVVALEVRDGLFSRSHYLPFANIKSIEHDVLMISSPAQLVDRGEFKISGLLNHLNAREVVTEDGKHLGAIHDYDVNIKNGEITSITVALETAVMGGLWQTVGERFDIPRKQISALGDSVIVDSGCAPPS